MASVDQEAAVSYFNRVGVGWNDYPVDSWAIGKTDSNGNVLIDGIKNGKAVNSYIWRNPQTMEYASTLVNLLNAKYAKQLPMESFQPLNAANNNNSIAPISVAKDIQAGLSSGIKQTLAYIPPFDFGNSSKADSTKVVTDTKVITPKGEVTTTVLQKAADSAYASADKTTSGKKNLVWWIVASLVLLIVVWRFVKKRR